MTGHWEGPRLRVTFWCTPIASLWQCLHESTYPAGYASSSSLAGRLQGGAVARQRFAPHLSQQAVIVELLHAGGPITQVLDHLAYMSDMMAYTEQGKNREIVRNSHRSCIWSSRASCCGKTTTRPGIETRTVFMVAVFFGYAHISNVAPPTGGSFDSSRHTSWADIKRISWFQNMFWSLLGSCDVTERG